MELGNILLGNSRGNYAIKRTSGWEKEIHRLFAATQGVGEGEINTYGEEFENDIFYVSPYYWGDCTCECGEDWISKDEHSKDCPISRHNFYYKPTRFYINWYKYPLRDAYKSHNIKLDEFRKIIDNCIKSIGGKNE